jgi:GNAT superfamily N-acetyltransferase
VDDETSASRFGGDGTNSTGSIRLRFARRDDAATIVKFIRELAEFEKLLDQCEATESAITNGLFGDNRFAECLIAEFDEVDGDNEPTPVGFALFFHTFSTFKAKPGIYLEDLYVAPKYRGRGVGAAILGELSRIALERNCARLEWAVLNWNERAIKFYRSLGATAMDEWTVYRMSDGALAEVGRR